jgi:hypothetical protein
MRWAVQGTPWGLGLGVDLYLVGSGRVSLNSHSLSIWSVMGEGVAISFFISLPAAMGGCGSSGFVQGAGAIYIYFSTRTHSRPLRVLPGWLHS